MMLELLGILLTHYAWLAAWLASAGLAGLALQSLLLDFSRDNPPWPNFELAVFFSISCGLAIQIVVLIALAGAQQLNATAVLLATLLLAASSFWLLRRQPNCIAGLLQLARLPWREWLAIAPVLLVIAAWLVRPLGAAAGSDSLTYHLPYARFYLEQGGLAVNETLRFPLHTHNVNLLYAAALLRPYSVESPAMAQMLHAAMGWLSLLGIYGAARHWNSWFTAVVAVLAVLLLDEFVISFSMAFVDNGVMLFVTGAFLALVLWQGRPGWVAQRNGWLWVAAILAGTAMGSKYLGAWFTVPLGIWVLWQSRSFPLAIRFALLVSATGLFWYLRSWWLVGNPVHPFASDLFGYSIWSEYDLQGQMRELSSHGVEKTWLNLLLLPWKMFTDWHRFNGAMGNIGFLVGAFMLGSLLLRWQRPQLRAIHITCLVYLLFWFFSSQVVRYLMIILPLMSLCTLTLWAGVLERLRLLVMARIGRRLPQVNTTTFATAFLAAVVLALFGNSGQRGHRELLWYPLTPEKQRQFLLEKQPAYAVALAAQADERTAAGPLLQFNLQEIRWFFPGKIYGDWMGKYPYRNFGHVGESVLWEINSGEVLSVQIEEIGAVAVVYSTKPGQQFSPQPLESYLREFEPAFQSDGAVLLVSRQMRWIAGKSGNRVAKQ